MSHNKSCVARHGLGASLTLIGLLLATQVLAQDAGFAGLNGSWRGSGTLQHQNGVTERLRCDANYRATPDRMRQTLRCSSDETNFSLAANLSLNGREISGEWTETTRNARGALRGRLSPGVIQGQVEGTGFSANIAIRFSGNQQNVSIRSAGTETSTVSMVLNRTGR